MNKFFTILTLFCLLLGTSVVSAEQVTAERIWQNTSTEQGFPAFYKAMETSGFIKDGNILTEGLIWAFKKGAIEKGILDKSASKEEFDLYALKALQINYLISEEGNIPESITPVEFMYTGQGRGWWLPEMSTVSPSAKQPEAEKTAVDQLAVAEATSVATERRIESLELMVSRLETSVKTGEEISSGAKTFLASSESEISKLKAENAKRSKEIETLREDVSRNTRDITLQGKRIFDLEKVSQLTQEQVNALVGNDKVFAEVTLGLIEGDKQLMKEINELKQAGLPVGHRFVPESVKGWYENNYLLVYVAVLLAFIALVNLIGNYPTRSILSRIQIRLKGMSEISNEELKKSPLVGVVPLHKVPSKKPDGVTTVAHAHGR